MSLRECHPKELFQGPSPFPNVMRWSSKRGLLEALLYQTDSPTHGLWRWFFLTEIWSHEKPHWHTYPRVSMRTPTYRTSTWRCIYTADTPQGLREVGMCEVQRVTVNPLPRAESLAARQQFRSKNTYQLFLHLWHVDKNVPYRSGNPQALDAQLSTVPVIRILMTLKGLNQKIKRTLFSCEIICSMLEWLGEMIIAIYRLKVFIAGFAFLVQCYVGHCQSQGKKIDMRLKKRTENQKVWVLVLEHTAGSLHHTFPFMTKGNICSLLCKSIIAWLYWYV